MYRYVNYIFGMSLFFNFCMFFNEYRFSRNRKRSRVYKTIVYKQMEKHLLFLLYLFCSKKLFCVDARNVLAKRFFLSTVVTYCAILYLVRGVQNCSHDRKIVK